MFQTHLFKAVLILAITAVEPALAGDPMGVNDALKSIRSNWPEAQFSVDLSGLANGTAIVDGKLQAEYEAALPGYVAYIRISSHGDMTIARLQDSASAVQGELSLPVQVPLGSERTVFIFSNQPLRELTDNRSDPADLGSDRSHAQALLKKIESLQAQGTKLVTRRFDYMVDAPVGQTQYTTRGIIREVEGQTNASHTKTVTPRFPTRIEFEFNSDRLTPQGKRDLDVFGAALTSKLKEKKVMLEGHTDDIGSDQYNLDLSERRAAVAKQYLLDSFGLPSEQVVAAGKGKSGSIAPNDSETDRSRNRRVDFIFTDAPTSK